MQIKVVVVVGGGVVVVVVVEVRLENFFSKVLTPCQVTTVTSG